MVDVPSPLRKDLVAYLTSIESNKETDACDGLICNSIKKIHEHRQRRAFFLGFSQSPAEFIDALITSQNKDLKFIAGMLAAMQKKSSDLVSIISHGKHFCLLSEE
jgi:SWI/SNF-related matrix-associated actin-dependent regulator of chromatin subfamily D